MTSNVNHKPDEAFGPRREDPINSHLPRGKNREQRKHRNDGPSWTGTERTIRDDLMRQFMRTGEGPGGNSDAYRNAECWCACGRLRADGSETCARCCDSMSPVETSP